MVPQIFSRKIFVFAAVIFTLMFSNCLAASQVNITDINAEDFFNGVREVMASGKVTKDKSFELYDLRRTEEKIPKFDNLTVWKASYGDKNSSAPDGEITFLVDEKDRVFSVGLATDLNVENCADKASILIVSICSALSLTEEEIAQLVSSGHKADGMLTATVKCSATNRNISWVVYSKDGKGCVDFFSLG